MLKNQDLDFNLMEIKQERNFMVFNTSEIDLINFSEVLEDSINTIRRNFDGSKAIVKWYGDVPNSVSLLLTSEGPYTHDELIEILSQPEWQIFEFL